MGRLMSYREGEKSIREEKTWKVPGKYGKTSKNTEEEKNGKERRYIYGVKRPGKKGRIPSIKNEPSFHNATGVPTCWGGSFLTIKR